MEFLSLEAEDDCPLLQFLDEEESEKTIDELDNLINDDPIEEEGVGFYRERNSFDINDYPRFNGQVRNPLEAIYSDNESYFGEMSNPSFMLRKIEMKLHLTDLKGLKSPFKLSKEP